MTLWTTSILHYLSKSVLVRVHCFHDTMYPFHPLPPPFPFVFNLSQHSLLIRPFASNLTHLQIILHSKAKRMFLSLTMSHTCSKVFCVSLLPLESKSNLSLLPFTWPIFWCNRSNKDSLTSTVHYLFPSFCLYTDHPFSVIQFNSIQQYLLKSSLPEDWLPGDTFSGAKTQEPFC